MGELLPDWYDDWVLLERERFRQLRLHALDALCDDLTRAGRHWDAEHLREDGPEQEPDDPSERTDEEDLDARQDRIPSRPACLDDADPEQHGAGRDQRGVAGHRHG